MSATSAASSRLGDHLKQQGLNLVEENNANFVETMRSVARRLARHNGSVTTDDLRAEACRLNLKPESPNAWGSILRGKEWFPTGYIKSSWPTNHSRRITIWKLTTP